jgi:hypothetical protein
VLSSSTRLFLSTLLLLGCFFVAGPGNPWRAAQQALDEVVERAAGDDWTLVDAKGGLYPISSTRTYVLRCSRNCGPRHDVADRIVTGIAVTGYELNQLPEKAWQGLVQGWAVSGKQGRTHVHARVVQHTTDGSGKQTLVLSVGVEVAV